jgi:predicted kinase
MVTQGLPGSGKSTWAFEQLKKEPGRWKRINNDHLRLMLDGGVFSRDNEDMLKVATFQLVSLALTSGFDVILDNTYLNPKALNKVHQFAASWGDVKVIHKVFPVDVEECLRRNALREGLARVPDKAITDMAKAAKIEKNGFPSDKEVYYPRVEKLEYPDLPSNRKKAIIVDLDGTLANINGRNPYDASNCAEDRPNMHVVELVKAMYKQGYTILFVSGRMDSYREQTKTFIEHHVTKLERDDESYPGGSYHYYEVPIEYELFMRKDGDSRKDSIIKQEIYENDIVQKYDVLFCVDDRPQVVRTWRYEIGLPVFAVDDREF